MMEDKIKILMGERECSLRAARGECSRMCDGCLLSRNHIAFISLCDWLIEMMRCGVSWLQEQEAKRGSVGGFACFVCGNCGVAITEGDRYCRHCGRKVLWK